MKKVLKHKYTHYLLVVVVALVAGYAYFGATSVGEAGVIKTIGSVKVTLDPDPPEIGTEFVSFQYNGIGVIDITGWKLENDSGFVYELPITILNGGDSIKICSHQSKDPNDCAGEWSGGFVWNSSDTLRVIDVTGTTLLEHEYTDKTTGNIVQTEISIDGLVLTKKDSVDVCHSANSSQYSNVNGNVSNIAKGKGGHGQHVDHDIIPPFFYFVDNVFGYYQGMNWEAGKETYENNCGKK